MTNSKQLAYYRTQQQQIEPVNEDELAIIRNRRAVKRLLIQQTLADRILETIAICSILSASLFGIGALGCWSLEIIDTSAKPSILSKQDWVARKHICFGWMLVGFSSFLASSSLGKKRHSQK
ncbi:hypothetical protein NIES4103_30590 [Nostoc sp. NIES-4103]|nr:hypothetical protein NIES4103_30590 [Nostoc sp. NIES-4103]